MPRRRLQAAGNEIATGLDLLEARHAVSPQSIVSFVHGTTVGINTIIQRRGAKLGLITTRGFEDVLELARLQMPDMYSLFCSRPDQLIPRDRIWGVGERILSDGSIETALAAADVVSAIAKARAKGCDGIVISFLNSYRNMSHEQQVRRICQELAPELFVFAAAEVWPVVREYERTSTAILNAYVHPRVAGYLDSLEQRLAERGVPAQPMITKSNGGVMSASLGKADCVGMLLSGTASGVIGAAYVAGLAGVRNALTLDIGGTSADVALVIDGAPQFASGEIVGDFPLNVPSVSVTSIGDGGGSIAAVNPIVGGGGGMPWRDGTNGSGADSAYLKNSPIEITEAEVPIQIVRYGLMPDSGGAGRWRGGLATSLDFKVFAPNSRITARNRDRSKFRPWGTLGGKAAAPSNFILNPGTSRERILGNTDFVIAEPGDTVHIHSPGGGGRGNPLEREAERVLEDVERGYVSAEAAERDYGVVIKDGEIDARATAARRGKMAAQATGHFFRFRARTRPIREDMVARGL